MGEDVFGVPIGSLFEFSQREGQVVPRSGPGASPFAAFLSRGVTPGFNPQAHAAGMQQAAQAAQAASAARAAMGRIAQAEMGQTLMLQAIQEAAVASQGLTTEPGAAPVLPGQQAALQAYRQNAASQGTTPGGALLSILRAADRLPPEVVEAAERDYAGFVTDWAAIDPAGAMQEVVQVAQEPINEAGETVADRGIFDKLGDALVGPLPDALSERERKEIRKNALFQAGIAIMAAGSQQGMARQSLGQAITAGVQAGQASAAQQTRQLSRNELLAAADAVDFDDPRQVKVFRRKLQVFALAGDREAERALQRLDLMIENQADKKLTIDEREIEQAFEREERERAERFKAEQARLDREARAAAAASGGGGPTGVGSIPTGHRLVVDPATGQPALVPIPGSPAAREIEEERDTEQAKAAQVRSNATQQLSDIQRARELARSGTVTTGFFSRVTRAVPGSDADQLQKVLATIEGNIALDRLIALKESGGTLGAVSGPELDLLKNARGALSQVQSKEELDRVLARLEEAYRNVLAATSGVEERF